MMIVLLKSMLRNEADFRLPMLADKPSASLNWYDAVRWMQVHRPPRVLSTPYRLNQQASDPRSVLLPAAATTVSETISISHTPPRCLVWNFCAKRVRVNLRHPGAIKRNGMVGVLVPESVQDRKVSSTATRCCPGLPPNRCAVLCKRVTAGVGALKGIYTHILFNLVYIIPHELNLSVNARICCCDMFLNET